MPKKDISQLAKFIVDQATGDAPAIPEIKGKAKSGRSGGLKGGVARAHKLTAKERSDIAKKAAAARWKVPTEA